jgi:hypothetical protein
MNHILRSVMSGPGATSWTRSGLAATLAACLGVSAYGQTITTRPELLSGPWELAGPSGVDGIFVMINQGTTDRVRQETIQVRVYHRNDGHETAGWYFSEFDGKHLRVAGLTATFDQDAARWTGEWVLDGQSRKVVLERPRPEKGVTPNSLCGDWEALPDATRDSPSTSIQMHIVQSSDGALTAWMDSVTVIVAQRFESQRYGRWLKVISADPMNIVLQNESPIFEVRGRFSGVLSDDRSNLTGNWNGLARETFRRIN